VQLLLVLAGGLAITWATLCLPSFRTQTFVSAVGRGIQNGEVYKAQILVAAESRVRDIPAFLMRPGAVNDLALIRLRMTEDAFTAGDRDAIDRNIEKLAVAVDGALSAAPTDPYLWLVKFWTENTRLGFTTQNLRFLRASYELGPHEGWVASRRGRLAIAMLPMLPPDLKKLATDEFVDLVKWGLASEAVDIAARVDEPVRKALFLRLKDVKIEERRRFAQLWYRRDLDSLTIPGVEPPPPPFRLPIIPPGF
jgi:hypothetical protein